VLDLLSGARALLRGHSSNVCDIQVLNSTAAACQLRFAVRAGADTPPRRSFTELSCCAALLLTAASCCASFARCAFATRCVSAPC